MRNKRNKKRVQRGNFHYSKRSPLLHSHHKENFYEATTIRQGNNRKLNRQILGITDHEVIIPQNGKAYTRIIPAITTSRRTIVCKRRRDRRVSLFASRNIGRGKRVNKERKFTAESKIKCRR